MIVTAKTENSDLATVYIGELDEGKYIEFAESVQPPFSINEKWILLVSTLYGCPVKCKFCDSGSFYHGKLSAEDIISQIDYLIKNRFGSNKIPVNKFKIQFARMGEPALNPNVLEVIEKLPELYNAPGLIPSISSIAPYGSELFFQKLKKIKDKHYKENFQLQFSLHTTDETKRDWLIPVKKLTFKTDTEHELT